VFSEGFELYIYNSSIIEEKNDQLKDYTASNSNYNLQILLMQGRGVSF